MNSHHVDVAIVGAGAAGIGVGVALSTLDLDIVILEREEIGASFRQWPDEMRFITPSFPSNSFGLTDLNSITPGTSPAVVLDREHPSGDEYADYLEAVADYYELPVDIDVEVTDVRTPQDATVSTSGSSIPQHTAVDGGRKIQPQRNVTDPETQEAPAPDGFLLDTNQCPIHCDFVVWATGQFGSPRRDVIQGAEYCVHTGAVSSWTDHASTYDSDEFLIIGGYESGIDAAVGLVEAGCQVRVLDRGEPWSLRGPDPSEVLSPYTRERLMAVMDADRLLLEGGTVVEQISRDDADRFEVRARAAEGHEPDDGESPTYTVSTPPILATGYEPHLGPVADHFPLDDGVIQVTEVDEAPKTSGLFLAGPDVTHNGVKFCFIYKFRSRFPVIAETIGSRLGIDTGPLDIYREQNMFLEDLSCCEPDMCDC